MPPSGYDAFMTTQFSQQLPAPFAKLVRGRAAEFLVLFGAAAILACDLLDQTLDPRIYAASEHALGSAAWLFHLGLGAILAVTLLLLTRSWGVKGRSGVTRALILAAVGIVGLAIFPTDPGWQVTTVAGRLHPTFAILAAGSLLFAGSRLAHRKRLIIDTVLLYGAGFAGYFAGGGAGAAERAALAVVGVLLFLAARRSR
ncbi:MAG: DUF998 domain-containing protein [bacterium]|nr:DUF998 domain-containing protein [Candidatus Aquidulcis frankliniae]